MTSRPRRSASATIRYADDDHGGYADEEEGAPRPRERRRSSQRKAAVRGGVEVVHGVGRSSAEGVRSSGRRRKATERYLGEGEVDHLNLGESDEVDEEGEDEVPEEEGDEEGEEDYEEDEVVEVRREDSEEEEDYVKKGGRLKKRSRDGGSLPGNGLPTRNWNPRMNGGGGDQRESLVVRVPLKHMAPKPPAGDPRDVGLLVQPPSQDDADWAAAQKLAEEEEREQPKPATRLRSRERKSPEVEAEAEAEAESEQRHRGRERKREREVGGSDADFEGGEDEEEEDDDDYESEKEDEFRVDDDLPGEQPPEDDGYVRKTRSGARAPRPTRSTRSAQRQRSRNSSRLSGRTRNTRKPYRDLEVVEVAGPRTRKPTLRLIDNLGVEPVRMRSSSRLPRERRRDRRGGGGGRDRDRGRDRRPSVDSDEEMLDSPSSSDTSDSDQKESAAAIDFAITPMAVEGDGRSRPSRYVRRRGRSDAIGAAGVPSGRKARPEPAGIEPIQVDLNLSWDDVGGLDHHVRALKEMVFLPLLYPEVFEKFKMEPPKGVLFYGPPGTGKTLCARALAASCGAVPVAVDPAAAGSSSPDAAVHDGKDTGASLVAGKGNATTGEGVRSRDECPARVIVNVESGKSFAEDLAASKQSPDTAADGSLKASVDAAAGETDRLVHKVVASQEDALAASDFGVPAADATLISDVSPPAGPAIPPVPAAIAANDTGLVGHFPAADAGTDANAKQRPRVAFFMRNGADCLSKWVGEAERQLRMTFEAAKKHQPSIIFFDEIDGLAPVRSARQDQIHSSIVSTLLGLMDGLDGRGQIVVIGATNRVDSVDPALRRPGRFDRELIFTLPNGVARRKILGIHTSHWKPQPPDNAVLDAVASKTVGYCGADLRALCSESALRALRRRYPQIYQSNDKLLINVDEVQVRTRDFVAAMKEIVPASHRSARTHARPIPSRLAPVLETPLGLCMTIIKRIFPQGITPELKAATNQKSNGGDVDLAQQGIDSDDGDESGWSDDNGDGAKAAGIEIDISRAGKERVVHGRGSLGKPVLRPRLLLCGRHGMGQGQIGPALLHYLEGCPVHAIDLPSLFADGGSRSSEESLVTTVREACRAVPSILFLPHLGEWWSAAHETLRTTLSIVLRDIPAELPLLVLATASSSFGNLPDEVKDMFADFVDIDMPSVSDRRSLFAPIVMEAQERPKVTNAMLRRRKAKRRAEILPKAPPPVLQPPTPVELERREADDERFIRQLRMEMREFVERLRTDRRFAAFRDPVDPSEVTDYFEVIKDPMWIGKIAEQIDKGMYPTVLAMVKDFDQLVANAIQYNPPHKEEGAAVLRRAHALVDIVHTWVDKLNPELVERCNAVVLARLRGLQAQSTKEEVDAATKATLPLTSLPPSSTTVAAGAAAQLVPADLMAMETPSSSLKANGIAREDGAQGSSSGFAQEIIGPSPTTIVEEERVKAEDGRSALDNDVAMEDCLKGTQEVADSAEEEEEEEEEHFVAASKKDIRTLEQSWLDVTTGMNVDSLDTLITRCSSLLYDRRRTSDRQSVVKSIANIVLAANDDASLQLVA